MVGSIEGARSLTYQVLARKWRPQVFDAVVGQDPVTRTLRNALASGRVAHAYLFTGARFLVYLVSSVPNIVLAGLPLAALAWGVHRLLPEGARASVCARVLRPARLTVLVRHEISWVAPVF